MQRALRERRERAHLLDLVAEEVDAQRISSRRGKDVDEPAAHGELAAILRALDALVTGESEGLGELLDPLLLPRRDPDGQRPRLLGRKPFGQGSRRDDDEAALLEHLERGDPLADEVRRRPEAGVPADTAARQQCDAILAQEPPRRLREISGVGVLRDEQRQRAGELLVKSGDEERQGGLGHAGTRRERGGELLNVLALEQLADEREEHRPLFDIPDHEA